MSSMVGIADAIMVSSVGETAVSAISLIDNINILVFYIFSAIATGGAVVCGQYLGKKEKDRACDAANNLMLFAVMLGILIMIGIYFARNFIISSVFGSIEEEIKIYCHRYLCIVVMGIPFIAMYNCGAALFRTMGDSKTSMLVAMMMNCMNIVGNAILIYVFHMGIDGVAIPTLVSQITAAAVMLILIRRQNQTVHLTKPFCWKPKFYFIRKILYIGIPNGIEQSLFQIGKITVLSLITTFGTAATTANAVGNTIANFQMLPGVAVGYAAITVISRCVGAGDYNQVRYYTRKLVGISYLSNIVVNLLLFAGLPIILRSYNLSEVTSDIARQIIVYHGICCMIIWPMGFTLPNTLRASNDVRYCMTVSIVSMWIFRVSMSYILADNLFTVWVLMTIDWLVRSLFWVIRYRGSRWQVHKI